MAEENKVWIGELFERLDEMDTEGFLEFVTDDCQFRFGNGEMVIGKDGIGAAVEEFFGSIKGLRHKLVGTWICPGTVICQGEVTYTRTDEGQVTVPFANIWQNQ